MRLRNSLSALLAVIFCIMSAGAALATKVEIIINKVGQKMTVKVDGDTEYVWPVSTGASGYETPGGTYKPFRMEAEHFSKEWDDAPMPHSIFFTTRGHAIHGSYYVKSLGRRASHGCVRLAPENAKILFGLVREAGMSNTTVTLRGGFFDFGTRTASSKQSRTPWWTSNANAKKSKRSFAAVGQDIDKTIKKADTKKKPRKVALKCTTKDGKKVCKKPFVLFGGTPG
jgi:L,D-transpeptidase catalytic domain